MRTPDRYIYGRDIAIILAWYAKWESFFAIFILVLSLAINGFSEEGLRQLPSAILVLSGLNGGFYVLVRLFKHLTGTQDG